MDLVNIAAAGCAFLAVLLVTIGFYQATARGRSRAQERMDQLQAYGQRAQTEGGVPLALRRQGSVWAERTLRDLDRAGVALKLHEYLALRGLMAVAFMIVGFALVGTSAFAALLAIVFGVVGFMLPPLYVRMRIQQQINKLNDQLEEMLTMVSSSLKAGFGLLQAFDLAAEQIPPPISVELKRLIRDTHMGATLEDAIIAMGERVGSYDLDMVITAVLIQRAVGSNLAEVLDNVAHTIRERIRIKGEINTLTAQKRLSGWIVGLMPLLVVGLFYLTDPEYMRLLFTTGVGRFLIILAAGLNITGLYITRRITAIEV
ncbi:MAG: type II secretion system F family protein [Chloroflexi bacterium]|nr:type II secretion system F family protein [Chloroflexota bacterium]